jgi:hypothetical protein
VKGFKGTVEALPLDRVLPILKQAGALNQSGATKSKSN